MTVAAIHVFSMAERFTYVLLAVLVLFDSSNWWDIRVRRFVRVYRVAQLHENEAGVRVSEASASHGCAGVRTG